MPRDHVLDRRTLNRTLLHRQRLLARVKMPVRDMVQHLVGLQAQDPLPPYLGLWSRIHRFDPLQLSGMLERREMVRIVLMRGTVHLISATDALWLRPLLQPMLDKITRSSTLSRPAAAIQRSDLADAGRKAFADGPRSYADLTAMLGEQFPDFPVKSVANTVRELVPLVQVPPRGLWRRSGGVVYETLENWVGRPMAHSPDPAELVRRYLRGFGPATAADVTAWSRLTGMAAVLATMTDELVEYVDEEGRRLVDLEGLPVVDGDAPAPVRLLGKYDNVWLSHAARDRVTDAQARSRWMGANGGLGNTVFVDGWMSGLWRVADGRVEVETFRRLGSAEQDQLDAEVVAVEEWLQG